MVPRLRWTEAELRGADPSDPIWRLARMIMVNALRKDASIVFLKRTSALRSVVLYAVDGTLVEEMQPPNKIHQQLVSQLMRMCGPVDVTAGTRAEFELIRTDGKLLIGYALLSANEWGLAVTIRLAPPPRTLN